MPPVEVTETLLVADGEDALAWVGEMGVVEATVLAGATDEEGPVTRFDDVGTELLDAAADDDELSLAT
jgi:hypothetical protein